MSCGWRSGVVDEDAGAATGRKPARTRGKTATVRAAGAPGPEAGGELSVWKIALGLCLAMFDVVMLIWLIGQHLSQWLTTASSGWWM